VTNVHRPWREHAPRSAFHRSPQCWTRGCRERRHQRGGGSAGCAAAAAQSDQGDLAKDNKLFLTLARKALKWDEPTAPAKIRRTHHFHEMQRPDIYLGAQAEWFNYEQKRDRAKSEGAQAWVNPEEYRQFVAKQKRAFEDQVDSELAARK
jgi:hypothetical protein